MSKKIIALCLVLALCVVTVSAFATDSKTTGDIVATEGESTPVTVVALDTESQAVLDQIAAVMNKGESVLSFFDADTQSAIAAAIPSDVKAEDLKLDEFFQLAMNGQDAANGGTVTLGTAASYADTDAVTVLLGLVKDGVTTWKVIPCTVVGGKLAVQLTASDLAAMQDSSAVVAVLSNKN